MPKQVPEAARRGVLSTNRPPAISKLNPILQKDYIPLGSEDTATLSLYVYWDKAAFKEFAAYFDEMKTAAQTGDHEKDHIDIDNKIYRFRPTGYKSGTGAGPMYRWAIECEGVRISIANQPEPKKEIPNVIVNIGSLFLMKNNGLLNAWSLVKDMIEIWFCQIKTVKISRIDGCVDLPDVAVTEYVTRFENNCFVSRAKKGSIYQQGKRKTGFKLGSSKQIRIYDKLLEVEHQPEKMLVLMQTRWGKRLPECATRIEYQVGSEDLRKLGIVTLGDYEDKRYSLFLYLSHEWFRMTDTEPRANNQSRTATSRFWEVVQRGFRYWTGQKVIETLNFKTDKMPNYHQLAKQGIGCISSIAALYDIDFDDPETFKHTLQGFFNKMLESEDLAAILKKTNQKRRRFNAIGRVI